MRRWGREGFLITELLPEDSGSAPAWRTTSPPAVTSSLNHSESGESLVPFGLPEGSDRRSPTLHTARLRPGAVANRTTGWHATRSALGAVATFDDRCAWIGGYER
jgi:hypothetical protein